MDPSQLVLRDVHLPQAPGLWPPAPGWWLLAGALLLIALFAGGWRWTRQRQRRRWLDWFDRQTRHDDPLGELAALSALLRRAARRVDAGADRLQGEAWLRFLDGARGQAFTDGPGQLLLHGAFQRQVDARAVEQLRMLARARFLELMAGQR
ncbi:DUF4381 domain-containing protein [Pseudoxanthomonas indica]|uniref:DUF4381 domain-containing protein n=1 Tax=Pseudoxanthomonas indica TaxID=428993 RepID=A0A1T5JTL5_9GAMM|nr:DUF4381 domain-containing protein [Pseudoxanthomonas indica]GGD44305.1 hypothetical protein GCM10007235_15320 [Pseudoxanthomonas indica]SKC54733.1 protein of unknown function [Pseudoxanthomonas indica]